MSALCMLLVASLGGRADGMPHSIAGLGDLDGDGAPEVLVGRAWCGRGDARFGTAVVFSARDGRVLHEYLAPTECGAFGTSVARWTDLDGDGAEEFAIGAPAPATHGCGGLRGAVLVYSGRTGALVRRLEGLEAGDEFGFELLGDVDVDHDGSRDLAVGSPGARRVCVFSGADGACRWRIRNELHRGRFGASLATLGDLDGDGIDDLAIGAPASGAGSVRIVSTATGATLRVHEPADVVRVERPSLPIAGSIAGSTEQLDPLVPRRVDGLLAFGDLVASFGDLDGDGVAELAIAANEHPARRGGRARVVAGSSGEDLFAIATNDRRATIQSLCRIDDVDRDGVDDWVVGVPHDAAEPPWTDGRGSVTCFSGKTRAVLWRAVGALRLDNLGRAVAVVGDVDGDGVDDLVVSAEEWRDATPEFRVLSGRDGSLSYAFTFPGVAKLRRDRQILRDEW